MGRGDKKAANGHGVDVQHDQESEKEDFNIKARLRSSSDPGSSAPDIETGDVSVPEPISRYETRPPKVKGMSMAIKRCRCVLKSKLRLL